MPIDQATFEKGVPVQPRAWRRYESIVAEYLARRFGQPFTKRQIALGKLREFDLVSSDGGILAKVKHTDKNPEDFDSTKKRNYFAQYMLDALMLERAPAKERLLVI